MNVPTVYACSVFGYCNAVARIFTILAVDPTIAELEYPDTLVIGLLLGIIGILVTSKLVTNLPKFEWINKIYVYFNNILSLIVD